ncbi:Hpt domain-containing protein [Chitiniphilus purpureus]|uniref:Hpt domain-containing protein n=1 Tax=Chitiniphilus purpureus TaxID=2981137 RepID=A0ABY6DPU3_9NEIS|nr:Hpt domain-containing protein [Chitiniphilus sp. CD1]UXY13933.1 Hpt domain-containing protein [Chitiniphilus sp. CD1]
MGVEQDALRPALLDAELASVERALTEVRMQIGMDLRAELLGAFLPLLQETMQRLPVALAAGEAEQAVRYAHKLKGAALQLGAGQLADGCRQIEAAARGGLLDTAAAALPRVLQLGHGLLSRLKSQ